MPDQEIRGLILNRRIGERIVITGGIVIELVEIWRGSAKIRIKAPEHIEIWREEISPCPNCGTKGNHQCSYRPH